MAWRRPGNKPLSELMMVSLLTHICVTQSQWVNYSGISLFHHWKGLTYDVIHNQGIPSARVYEHRPYDKHIYELWKSICTLGVVTLPLTEAIWRRVAVNCVRIIFTVEILALPSLLPFPSHVEAYFMGTWCWYDGIKRRLVIPYLTLYMLGLS